MIESGGIGFAIPPNWFDERTFWLWVDTIRKIFFFQSPPPISGTHHHVKNSFSSTPWHYLPTKSCIQRHKDTKHTHYSLFPQIFQRVFLQPDLPISINDRQWGGGVSPRTHPCNKMCVDITANLKLYRLYVAPLCYENSPLHAWLGTYHEFLTTIL